MLNVYIAHNFKARDYLRETIIPMYFSGCNITSRWIYDDLHNLEAKGEKNGLEDLEDIDKADILVICTDQYSDRLGKGKWFEWGYAYAKQKVVIVVGYNTECVFWHLPNQVRVDNWAKCKVAINEVNLVLEIGK